MYYIAFNDGKDKYRVEEAVEDWHSSIDGFEPIDCTNGEMIIYDEKGHKYLVGPDKPKNEKKLFLGISSVDVGQWDFDKGEPYLIDTKETDLEELQRLLKDFKE